VEFSLESLFLQPGDHYINNPLLVSHSGTPPSLCYISTTPFTNPESLIRVALQLDFPIYERHCPLSPNDLCTHDVCPKALFCVIGFCKFVNKEPTFVPIPATPQPIHEFVCDGCGEDRGRCREGCSSFLEEHTGYWVFAWDRYSRSFKQERIPLDNYNPFHHGFFSYKSWRNTQVDAKWKHQDWEKAQSARKKVCQEDSPTL
jgi:hypothetical protein